MKLNIWGTVATFGRTGLTIGPVPKTAPDPKEKIEITEDDIFSGSRRLEKLSAFERMEVLTDALERSVREQTGLEESFYELVIRVHRAQAELDRPGGAPETVWNLNTQRLDQEVRRLQALIGFMDQATSKIELLQTHFKVVTFSASELDLQVARRDCILSIDEFLGRARRCRGDATRFQARLYEERAEVTKGPREI
ncbi:MAG: hypothetical protein AAGC79_10805 [Pseudomonadota bacterium]